MYYQPSLPDGTPVRLPWQLRSFFSNMSWPLRDNPARCMRIVDCIAITITFLSFLQTVESGIYFFINNLSDISLCTEAFATIVIYTDTTLRLFNMAFRKESFKLFLMEFYRWIYIDEKENLKMNKNIRRSIIPIDIYSVTYIFALSTFCLGPIVSAILYNSRLLPHKLKFHYELEDPVLYGFTLFQITCNGLCASLFVTGEICLLANFIGHFCARLTMLQNELEECASLLSTVAASEVAQKFRSILDNSIMQTNKLKTFAKLINETYTFQMFVMIAHSTAMLCVLIFQTSTSEFGSATFIAYMVWMFGKILELTIMGALGSKLITTTDNISSMYYHCNWEAISCRSTNRSQNVLLMKQISLSILLYQKPMELNGYGFFNVSLERTAALIRVAGSYFTFLKTFA